MTQTQSAKIPGDSPVQREIAAQIRRNFKKEIRLLKRHQEGRHDPIGYPIVSCDLCMNRKSSLSDRISAFKDKNIAQGLERARMAEKRTELAHAAKQ